MSHRFTPTKVVTVTKDGECHLVITLELNINLNAQEGVGNVSASLKSADRCDVENSQFIIPDFSSGTTLDFGKEE